MPVVADQPRTIETNSEQRTLDQWLPIIKAEYREMPGLQLTKLQVQRLWRLDPHACDVVLDALVEAGFLRKPRARCMRWPILVVSERRDYATLAERAALPAEMTDKVFTGVVTT